jgi:hypothetical protein
VETKLSILEVLEMSLKGSQYQIQREKCGTATIQVEADKQRCD